MSKPGYFLEIRVNCQANTTLLLQDSYVQVLIKKIRMEDALPAENPMDPGVRSGAIDSKSTELSGSRKELY